MHDSVSTGVVNTGGLRPPPLGMGGGGSSSKFDGVDLSQNIGGAWGELKMLSKKYL